AKSFADSGRFLVRDHANFGVGLVYPALIAPAWRLFSAVPDAYAAAKAINSVVMSLAALPAYALARRIVSQPLALLAALLALAVLGGLVFQTVRGGSILGAYQATTSGDYTVGGSLRWLLYHVGELSLYVGVVPLAAFALLVRLAPRLSRELQAFLAAAL